jgi:hypothetical protein
MEDRKKTKKRRDNLLYGIRKKGVIVNTKKRTVYCYFPLLGKIEGMRQVVRLRKEYGFVIQLNF